MQWWFCFYNKIYDIFILTTACFIILLLLYDRYYMFISYNFVEIQQLKDKIENSRVEKETLVKESDILTQGTIIG